MLDPRDFIVQWGDVSWNPDEDHWFVNRFWFKSLTVGQSLLTISGIPISTLLEIQWDAELVGMEPMEWLDYCDGDYISTPYRAH